MARLEVLVCAVAGAAVIGACGPPEDPPCGPDVCAGCCDSSGQCVTGEQPEACGTGGQSCQTCGGAATCVAGVCRAEPDAGDEDAGTSADAGEGDGGMGGGGGDAGVGMDAGTDAGMGGSADGGAAGLCYSTGWCWEDGYSNHLHGAWVSPSGGLWAVGDRGDVFRVAGATRSLERLPGVRSLKGVWGLSDSDVWAVGDGGIWHWNGSGWSASVPGASAEAVWGSASGDVWAVGPDGFRRWNGMAWSNAFTVPSLSGGESRGLRDVWGVASDHAWAAGAGGGLYHWNGTDWSAVATADDAGSGLLGVWAESRTSAWAVGETRTTLRWDGGSWGLAGSQVPGANYYAVAGEPGGEVYCAAASTVLLRWNGTGWSFFYNYNALEEWRDIAVGSSGFWIVGDDGLIFRKPSGGTWSVFQSTTNVGYQDVWALAPNDVWVVGRLFQHFDGRRWSNQTAPVDARAVWGSAPSDVWTVGAGGLGGAGGIARWDGGSWARVDAGPGLPVLNGVTGTAANDVWAVGNAGVVMHWDGTGWSRPIDAGTAVNLNAVWAAGPADVFVVGDQGVVARFDGSSWTATTEAPVGGGGTPLSLYGVHGVNRDDVFAVGAEGVILRWDGARWNALPRPVPDHLLDVWGSSATGFWAITSTSDAVYWDGGAWGPAEIGISRRLNGVGGLPSGHVWVAGDHGVILGRGQR